MMPLLDAFTSALLHFVWQGCAVCALLWMALFALRRRSANARYAAACAALAILAVAPIATTLVLYRPHASAAIAAAPPAAQPPLPLVPARVPLNPAALATVRVWALPLWACGVIILSLRLLLAYSQIARIRRRGRPADELILTALERLSSRMGIGRRARVLISEWTGSPCLVGWLQPVILLPISALSGLTPQQLDAVLAHELAHIRRHDYLVNWLQMIIETLLFYHPAVWWISRRIRQERELCCDDLAIAASRDAVCYARALTALEKLRAAAPAPALRAADGSLLYRIQRIAGAAAHPYAPSRASAAVALALACAFGIGLHFTRAQNQPSPDLLRQGDLALRAGQTQQALNLYLQGLAAANFLQRPTFEKRAIEVYMRTGQQAQAAAMNQQLLQEHPDDIDGLGLAASFLTAEGNAAEAIPQFQELLRRDPRSAVLHFDLGQAYEAHGDIALAKIEIGEALRLRPDFQRARRELEKLIPGGQPELAAAQARLNALQSQPNPNSEAVREAKLEIAIFEEKLRVAADSATDLAHLQAALADAESRLKALLDQPNPNADIVRNLKLQVAAARQRLAAAQKSAAIAPRLETKLADAQARLKTFQSQSNPDPHAIRGVKLEIAMLEERLRAAGVSIADIPHLQSDLADAEARLKALLDQPNPDADAIRTLKLQVAAAKERLAAAQRSTAK